MKSTKTLKSNSTAKKQIYGSFTPIESIDELNKQFFETQKNQVKLGNGENDNFVNDFQWVTQALISSCGSGTFSLQDAFIFARHLETPMDELKILFEKWVKFMKSKNRITAINGAYDFEVYAFV